MIGLFFDTFVVLTMTALIVISTLYAGNGPLASGAAEGISKTNMAQLAFSAVLGDKVRPAVRRGVPVLLRVLHGAQLELLRQGQC